MTGMRRLVVLAVVVLGGFFAPPSQSADKFGVFETIYESSVSFAETAAEIEAAFAGYDLVLHGSHEIRLPDDTHKAKIFVLTSPAFAAAAAAEPARSISAQILRVAVHTAGEEQQTYVNMANPEAQAMVFYANSQDYDALLDAARQAAAEIRQLVSSVPGNAVSEQKKPLRTEKHYRKYKGDGPARMMTKFRTWKKSQLLIDEDTAENFDAVVERVIASLESGTIADAAETEGWETIALIRLRDDAVYIGVTNPFIEDKMVRINSRFRKDDKSDKSPYPGVDHVAALPTDVLVVKEGDATLVLHYGQMWRMQLYFWDSGYRAFTANMGVPGEIVKSIKSAIVLSQ
jgi:hypothetical protein